jgi:hypothetical protein
MTTAKTNAPAKGKSLDEFRAAHDKNFIVPQKIKAGLVKLGDSWMYEMEFMKLCGLSTTDLAMFREEFKAYYVEVGRSSKRVWAGTPQFAKVLREKMT